MCWLGIDAVFQPAAASTDNIRWEIVDGSDVASVSNTYGPRAEVDLLKPGKATLQATCGGKTAQCVITVKGLNAIAPGGVSKVTLSPDECIGYTFTPEKSGNYYFYEAARKGLEIIVWDAQHNWVDGTGDGRARILNAKAGETYKIIVTNYYPNPVTAELHLEEAVAATGMTLNRAGGTNNVYAGMPIWVIAYTQPLNGYQGQLEWKFLDDGEDYVDFLTEDYDPRGDALRLFIHEDAAGKTLKLRCTDTENPEITADLSIVVKERRSIALAETYSVTQSNEAEFDLATFVPPQDGTYVLKASAEDGEVMVWVYTDDEILGQMEGDQTEMVLTLKKGIPYTVDSALVASGDKQAIGDYELGIIRDGVNPISFASDHVTVEKDGTNRLTLNAKPGLLSGLAAYTSSDPTVAEVAADGKVTGKKAGTAYITASVEVGGRKYTAQCRVDVISDEETITSVQLSTAAPRCCTR